MVSMLIFVTWVLTHCLTVADNVAKLRETAPRFNMMRVDCPAFLAASLTNVIISFKHCFAPLAITPILIMMRPLLFLSLAFPSAQMPLVSLLRFFLCSLRAVNFSVCFPFSQPASVVRDRLNLLKSKFFAKRNRLNVSKFSFACFGCCALRPVDFSIRFPFSSTGGFDKSCIRRTTFHPFPVTVRQRKFSHLATECLYVSNHVSIMTSQSMFRN